MALRNEWSPIIENQAKKLLTLSKVTLSMQDCQSKECSLGNLICDSMVHEFLKLASYNEPYWAKVSIALLRASDIYNSFDKGPLTYDQVYELLPYESDLVAITLTGKDLMDLLTESLEEINLEKNITSTYNFMQFSGLKVTYNIRSAKKERVIKVQARCAECSLPQYENLDLLKSYQVITTRYLANNKNFLKPANQPYYFSKDLDALLNYIKNLQPLVTGVEGRIKLL